MRQRLRSIEPVSAGFTIAIIGGIYGLVAAAFILIAASANPYTVSNGAFGVFAVIVGYPIGGYISGALTAWLYNLAARFTGGIEYRTAETDIARPNEIY